MDSFSEKIKDENLEDIACIIKFILILDNTGKRIYCNYYTQDYPTIESQLEFEKRVSKITSTFSVEQGNNDIFNFENYNIICNIDREVAIFIGQSENDNEILLDNFFKLFQTQLFNFVGDNLTREKMFNHYNDITLLVDELITGGLILDIDENSIYTINI